MFSDHHEGFESSLYTTLEIPIAPLGELDQCRRNVSRSWASLWTMKANLRQREIRKTHRFALPHALLDVLEPHTNQVQREIRPSCFLEHLLEAVCPNFESCFTVRVLLKCEVNDLCEFLFQRLTSSRSVVMLVHQLSINVCFCGIESDLFGWRELEEITRIRNRGKGLH